MPKFSGRDGEAVVINITSPDRKSFDQLIEGLESKGYELSAIIPAWSHNKKAGTYARYEVLCKNERAIEELRSTEGVKVEELLLLIDRQSRKRNAYLAGRIVAFVEITSLDGTSLEARLAELWVLGYEPDADHPAKLSYSSYTHCRLGILCKDQAAKDALLANNDVWPSAYDM